MNNVCKKTNLKIFSRQGHGLMTKCLMEIKKISHIMIINLRSFMTKYILNMDTIDTNIFIFYD